MCWGIAGVEYVRLGDLGVVDPSLEGVSRYRRLQSGQWVLEG